MTGMRRYAAAIKDLVFDPFPIRTFATRVVKKLSIGSYEYRLRIGAVERPHYGYCVYHAARLASRLGYPRISILELGVAGGRGLVNLEYHAEEVERLFPVGIDIYGFDTGRGLPQSQDYRDLPYHWKAGFYKMDVAALQTRLHRARLVMGDIGETSKNFFQKHDPSPVAAIFYDLDYYSSTKAALTMLDAGESHYLPRVFCYFDDTTGSESELYSDYVGERLAINEFNESHRSIKFGMPYHLLGRKFVEPWHHKVRIGHFFSHPRFNDFVGSDDQQLPCSASK
jgi:hypothetical protein